MARLLARYRALMEQLADEAGGWSRHGVKRAVARRLGIGDAQITKLLGDPTRGVSIDTINAAIASLNLDPRYFWAERLVEGEHYSAYAAGSEAADPPFWAEFLERYAVPRSLPQAEIDRVRSLANAEAKYLRSYEDLVSMADGVRLRSL